MIELDDNELSRVDVNGIFNRVIEHYVEDLLSVRWTNVHDNPEGDSEESDEESLVFHTVKPAGHDNPLLFLSLDQRKLDGMWRASVDIGGPADAVFASPWVSTREEAEGWFTWDRLTRAAVYGLMAVMEMRPARRTPTEETYLHQLRLHVPGVDWRKDTETGFIGRLPTTEDPDGSLEVVFHSLTDVHVIHRRKNGELLSQARGASLASAAGKVLEHVKRTGLAMFNLRSVMELDLYKKPEPPPPASEQVMEALQDQASRNYRWAYALLVELAKVELDIANSEAQPGEWPAGQDWSGLGATSRSAFLRRARDRAGIDHDEFLAPVRHGLVDIEDLFEGSKLPPAQVLLDRTGEGMRIISNPIETGPWGEDRALCRLHAVTNGWAVGFRFDLRGETGFVYLNPSSGSDDPECEPDVFLYYGPAGDPGEDQALSHTNIGGK